MQPKTHVPNTLPKHIAIIMDGNGRWAQARGKPRVYGHTKGVQSVQETIEACVKEGIQYLTLYAFSEENWGRPATEVRGILSLLNTYIIRKREELKRNNVRLRTIGSLSRLPANSQNLLKETKAYLADGTGLTLTVAISYGARNEIVQAAQQLAQAVARGELKPEQIDQECFASYLDTAKIPDPDLFIRTSGEQRVSNFLLWQISYSELWFTPVMWPDFRARHLLEAIDYFQTRKRRFGLTDAQINFKQSELNA